MTRPAPTPARRGAPLVSGTPLEVRLREGRDRLNARRLNLMRSILDHAAETFFLSSRQLAQRYHVDAATVVRTIQALGYRSFSDFSADLRQQFVARMSPYTIMKAASQEKRTLEGRIGDSLDRDLENLGQVKTTLSAQRVAELARKIHRARKIVVVGVDLAASLAGFLAYGLLPLGFDAEAPVGSSGNLFHRVRLLSPQDFLIAISFGACLRETVEAAQRAKARGVPTLAITDSSTTPLAQTCDASLIAPTSSPLFTRSYVASMGAINALLTACAYLVPRQALETLRQTEEEYRSGARWYKDPPGPGRPGSRSPRS